MAENITSEEEIKRTAFIMSMSTFLSITQPILFHLSLIADVFMLAFFFTNFCKRNSHYRKPYYILLVIGFSFHFCENLFYKYLIYPLNYQLRVPYMLGLAVIKNYYFELFYSIWNAMLVLNKITAVWFPLKHEKIWIKSFKKMVFIMLGIPFIPVFYLFGDIDCYDPDYYTRYYELSQKCLSRGATSSVISTTISYALFIFFLTLIIVYHKKKVSSFSPQLAKIEKRLMFQALTSLILYGIHRTLDIACYKICWFFNDCSHMFLGNRVYVTLSWLVFNQILLLVLYLIDIILLIVISNLFRNDFFNFYTFGYYRKFQFKKISHQRRIFSIKPTTPKKEEDWQSRSNF